MKNCDNENDELYIDLAKLFSELNTIHTSTDLEHFGYTKQPELSAINQVVFSDNNKNIIVILNSFTHLYRVYKKELPFDVLSIASEFIDIIVKHNSCIERVDKKYNEEFNITVIGFSIGGSIINTSSLLNNTKYTCHTINPAFVLLDNASTKIKNQRICGDFLSLDLKGHNTIKINLIELFVRNHCDIFETLADAHNIQNLKINKSIPITLYQYK